MKIAFDAKRALNNPTGLGNHARILINALMRDYPGNEYLLYTPQAKDEFFNQLHGNFELHFPETRLQKSFHAVWRSFGIKKQLTQKRVDVYHGLSNELPFGIRHNNSRNIVTIHDLIFLKHTEQYPFIDRRIYELKTRYAVKHADKIIAVSQETKRDIIDFYKVPDEKIDVIYQSVAPIFYEQKLSQTTDIRQQTINKTKYILNVGSFFPRKNQIRLIKAFALIEPEIEEELWLVGSNGSIIKEARQLIIDKKLEQRVKILDQVKNDHLPALYQRATVFVFPSLFEGFGMPILEALFSRTPVIASAGGAMEEAAGKNSVFIDPLSIEDIAEKILKVLKNQAQRTRMMEAGYAHAQTMTDTVFAQKVMQVYREV